MIQVLLIFGIVAIAVVLMTGAAVRFAARRRRSGEWDEDGPIRPTEGKDDKMGNFRRVTGLDWRL